jgi:hypothetical protein
VTAYAIAILVCLAGHPDRCASYTFVATTDDCSAAAWAWAHRRPWLVPVVAVCTEEEGA